VDGGKEKGSHSRVRLGSVFTFMRFWFRLLLAFGGWFDTKPDLLLNSSIRGTVYSPVCL
jgi:hypothetical protein